MFRKLTVIVCLISFCPAAVGAQDLAGHAGPQAIVNQPAEQPQPNLSLPVQSYPAGQPTVAENPLRSEAANRSGAPKVEGSKKEKSPGLTMKEWAEIHLGDDRWIWWAGAAVALIAIHVAVFAGNKNQ